MNLIKKTFLAFAAVVAMATPATAKTFSFGPRVGVCVNNLSLSTETFSSDNRAGFTGGLQVEAMLPILNLGVDLSAMYVRRSTNFLENQEEGLENTQRDYITLPLDLKWKISIPAIGSLCTPYIFTGPEFSFLASKAAATEAWNDKKVNVSWNIGAGLQLFSHLQIGASYGFGISKAATYVLGTSNTDIAGKNKYWTVTAAWLF